MNDLLFRGKPLGDEYQFLYKDAWVEKSLFIVLGGSYCYGTNVEDSDIDLRMCIYNAPEELLGVVPKFDSWEHDKTDTVVYGLEKYISLLMQCNPNVLENLGCRDEDYLYMTNAGRQLIENKDMFLSKQVIAKYGGYSNAQFNRMMNAILDDKTAADKEAALAKSLDSLIKSFNVKYNTDDLRLSIFMTPSDLDELEQEIALKGYFGKLPLRKVREILAEIDNLLKIYNKLNHRNNKKTKEKLAKHMMHLIRLYMTGYEILTSGVIQTYVGGAKHELLMDIRNGKYNVDEKRIYPVFFEIVEEWRQKFEEGAKSTILPDQINRNRVNEIVFEINKMYLRERKVL